MVCYLPICRSAISALVEQTHKFESARRRGLELQPSPSGLRLLIVDDDPVLNESLRDTLAQDGHCVTVANGGQAGIDAFQSAQQTPAPFDVVGKPPRLRELRTALSELTAPHPND